MAKAASQAAVIGSGFGGLAAAIRLQAGGVQTTLFEARQQLGGRASVFRDKGYTFDAGPTVITAPACLEELFEVCGEKLSDHVELMPVNPYYRLVWEHGAQFDYAGDIETQVAQQFPADLEGYRRFVNYSREVFDAGYTQLAATPFLRFSDMVRVAPKLMRLRADRSVYTTVSRFVKSDILRQALSFHSLLVGGNPFTTSSIYTLIHYLERNWGVFFPRGGTGALVQALVDLFVRHGGIVKTETPIESIRRQSDGRLALSHGATSETFDAVVSNADVYHTYAKLLAGEPAAGPMRKKLNRADWSMSLVVLYFGTNKRWSNTAHHTVIFGPRYQGLLKDIFGGSSIPDDFSLYLHAPTVTDPSLAPPGCESFYVLSPVPHLGHAKVDWSAIGEAYADRILAYLERWYPGLRASVVTRHLVTPSYFEQDLGARYGAAFSLAPSLVQSAYFRPHNRDDSIPGLYIAGAGTHPGAGIPGVVNSAKATAGLVLGDLKR